MGIAGINCEGSYTKDGEKKIKPVKSEEMKKYREEFECSLSFARELLEKRNIHDYINECETVDDLKKVLHLLVDKVY